MYGLREPARGAGEGPTRAPVTKAVHDMVSNIRSSHMCTMFTQNLQRAHAILYSGASETRQLSIGSIYSGTDLGTRVLNIVFAELGAVLENVPTFRAKHVFSAEKHKKKRAWIQEQIRPQ